MASEIEKRANQLVGEAQSKISPRTFLASEVRAMDRSDVEILAVAYLLAQMKTRQRHVVASIEREAQAKKQIPNKGTKAWFAWLETPEGADEKERQIQYAKEDAEATGRLWAEVQRNIDRFAAELRMEWNDELLRSDFALADGSKVTWGDASREDHEWRASMHSKNAAAGIEGAARHRAAIDLLVQTGANTLNDAVTVAA